VQKVELDPSVGAGDPESGVNGRQVRRQCHSKTPPHYGNGINKFVLELGGLREFRGKDGSGVEAHDSCICYCSFFSTMATTTTAGSASSGPPFPDDVPIVPLLRLSLHKLLKRDDAEIEHFNRACEDLGFFYLDLKGDGDALLRDANQLFDVAAAFCDLPLEEKEKYDFSNQKSYFGYKAQGAAVVDRNGNLDRNEFYNVSH
jgi:hypothetical protein